jgi:hypothetical protein
VKKILLILFIGLGLNAAEYYDAYKCAEAKKLLKVFPGGNPDLLPKTLHTPEKLKALKEHYTGGRLAALLNDADYYATISPDRWKELIPDRSPAPRTMQEGAPGTSGYITDKKCIMCGANGGYCYEMDFKKNPFAIQCKHSGRVFHELASERTPEEKKELVGETGILHFDGKERKLKYGVSKNIKIKGVPVKFFPANYVWDVRIGKIIGMWSGGILPTLTEAYLLTHKPEYATAIIRILTRFAEVFPHYPLAFHNGLATYSRKEFLEMAKKHEPVGDHGWLGPSRISAASANFRPPEEGYRFFNITKAYMAVADSGALKGREKEFIRKDLLEEGKWLIYSYGAKQCVTNGISMYAPGILALGIALDDDYLKAGFLNILEEFLYNENYYDGISIEGSANYAGMVSGMYKLFDDASLTGKENYLKEHPFLKSAGKTAPSMSTIRGGISQHGDGPNYAFQAGKRGALKPTTVLGGSGFTILRSGSSDKRLEIIFSHDRMQGHSHDDMLGIQVFYDGVPMLQHLGDSRLGRFLELRQEKNELAKDLLSLPYPCKMKIADMGRKAFSMALPNSTLTKNTVTVDEYGEKIARAPWRGGFGSSPFSYGNLTMVKTDGDVQIAEAVAENAFTRRFQKHRNFRRTLITINRKNGQSYVVDIFYVDGGFRHLQLYDSRATVVASNVNTDSATRYGKIQNWGEKQDRSFQPDSVYALGDKELLDDFTTYRSFPEIRTTTLALDYNKWKPKTSPSKDKLPDDIEETFLKIHTVKGARNGNELAVTAKSDFPAIIDEKVGGKRFRGMVEFKDGLNYTGTLRSSESRLKSCFVNVLEPWHKGENSFIDKIDTCHISADGSVNMTILFKDGTTEKIRYYAPASAEEGVRLSVDNTKIREFRGRLLKLAGDITGRRSEGQTIALQTYGKWPKLDTLTGKYVSVGFNNGSRIETYPIEKAVALGEGKVKLLLKGAPPFVDLYGKVKSLTEEPNLPRGVDLPSEFIGTISFKGGAFKTPYLLGSKIAFPESGLLLTLKNGEFYNYNHSRFDVLEKINLKDAGVKKDSKFVVFPEYQNADIWLCN